MEVVANLTEDNARAQNLKEERVVFYGFCRATLGECLKTARKCRYLTIKTSHIKATIHQ